MLRKLWVLSLLLAVLLCNLPVTAQQSRQLSQEDFEKSQKRLALVIGNGDYDWAQKLLHPVNDATDMTRALRDLDFEVISGTNLSLAEMTAKVREFGEKLKTNGGVGLFYYAGHGVQVGGKNFLIPVEAEIPDKSEIDAAAVNLDFILKEMGAAKNDLNIVILDANRKNPFTLSWGSSNAEDGLAQISAPGGTFIAYAAAPASAIPDGEGKNSLYATELLKRIRNPNMKIQEVFKLLTDAVERESGGKQLPWTSSNMSGEFYLKPVKTEVAVKPTPVAVSTPTVNPTPIVKSDSNVSTVDNSAAEKESWDLVKDSSDERDFRFYLEEFPNGANAANARARLEQVIWNKAKASNDKAKIQAYLKEFPNGVNAPTARIRLRQLESRATTEESVEPKEDKAREEKQKEVKTAEVKPKETKPKDATQTKTSKTKTKTATTEKIETRKNDIGMELVYIPAGSFMMGSSERNVDESFRLARKDYAEVELSWFDNEKPQRKVTFEDGFWMGKTEVTQSQWTAMMGENPSNFKGCDDCPVELVSWEDARRFIQKLNEKNDDFEYRLPSEAEWEYAARAGTTGLFAGPIDAMAWLSANSGDKTHPVGEKQANAFGLYDMYGNVAEWCEDIYSQTYEELPVDGSANTSIGDSSQRIVRGASWNNFPSLARSPARDKYRSTLRNIVTGFRVAARVK